MANKNKLEIDVKVAQTFLLQKIVDNKKNGLSSLGQLNAKHVDDIATVMKQFAEAVFKIGTKEK